jgi:signal transduction histidine kinase
LCVYHVLCGLFGEQPPDVALRWGLLSFALSLLLLAAPPLLRLLLGRGTPARDWWIFGAVYGGLALAAAIIRSLLTPWATGVALPPDILRSLAASMVVSLGISIAGMEALVARIVLHDDWQQKRARLRRELAESRSRLVRTDDALRREAAEYLHGEIQSRLLIAWALLDQARSAPEQRRALTADACAQLSTLRQDSLGHARLLMGIPNRLLSECIDELLERFRAVLPITMELSPEGRDREANLSDALRAAAQDMVEEGLLNAFRHAAASHVTVRLTSPQPGSLAVEVRDDGLGFEPDAHAKGLGLSGLGDTLKALGGTWHLDSAPGRGTCLTLTLPLHSASELEAA